MNKWISRALALCLVLCLSLAFFPGFAEEEGECGLGEAAYDERSYDGVTAQEYVLGVQTQRQEAAAVEAVSDVAEAPEVAVLGTDYSNENSTRGFVYRMYKVVLGREPDPAGLEMWVSQLNSGRMTAADIVTRFFWSAEYTGKGKTSAEIVDDCYNAMLGRGADPGGKAHWKERLDVGMTPAAVCRGFVGSAEFSTLCAKYGIRPGTINLSLARDQNYERTYFVYRLYQNCLGRNPDTAGLEHWCGVLARGGSGTQVARGFIFSEEAWNQHLTNSSFVTMLYSTILGRSPDTAGLNDWTNKLNYSSSREYLLNGFMFSAEFRQQCARAGIQLGGRIDEPDYTVSWQYNIQVLRLVNSARAAQGLPLLSTREDLWRDVAGVRAKEVQRYFSHTRPDGSTCWTAYDQAGIQYWTAGENIAYGYSTPQSVFNAWMNSTGHRANILNSGFEDMATAYYHGTRPNWAQNFMTVH